MSAVSSANGMIALRKFQIPDHSGSFIPREGFHEDSGDVDFQVTYLTWEELDAEKVTLHYQNGDKDEFYAVAIQDQLAALRKTCINALSSAKAVFEAASSIEDQLRDSYDKLYQEHYDRFTAASNLLSTVVAITLPKKPTVTSSHPFSSLYESDDYFPRDVLVTCKHPHSPLFGMKVHSGVLKQGANKVAQLVTNSHGTLTLDFSAYNQEVVALFMEFLYKGSLGDYDVDLAPALYQMGNQYDLPDLVSYCATWNQRKVLANDPVLDIDTPKIMHHSFSTTKQDGLTPILLNGINRINQKYASILGDINNLTKGAELDK